MANGQRPDIHNVDITYEWALKHFRESPISEENRQLCLEFINAKSIGWGGNKKVGKHQLLKFFVYLREDTKMLESLDPGLTWLYLQKKHTMQILLKIDNKETWGDWAVTTARKVMKQFVTWIRKEHKYPDDYPDSKKLNDFLPFIKTPVEVDYTAPRPRKLKDVNEIPTQDEINKLISAWDEQIKRPDRPVYLLSAVRNQAVLAILAEVGIRIGGLGDLQIKDVSFDELGARITVIDKTMQGQPVRLITSAKYLRKWLELHPWNDDPNAPLWPVLMIARSKKIGGALTYNALLDILIYSQKRYNKYAKEKSLPLITRRLHFHAFRYFAQTRDMLEGMPISIQCAQRGWVIDSDRPQYYARVTTGQVDQWLAAKHGLTHALEKPAEPGIKLIEPKKELASSKAVKKEPRWPPKPRKEQLVHRQGTGTAKLPTVNKAKSCITCATKYPGCQSTCLHKPFLSP